MDSKGPPPPPTTRAAVSKPPPPPPLRSTPSQKPPLPAGAAGPTAVKSTAPPPVVASRPPSAPAPAPASAPPPALALAPPPPGPDAAHARTNAVAPVLEKQTRVSLKVSARDPGLFIARPLADGQPPPAGTREAMLVLVDPAGGPGAE
jgi:hypothetical protein